MRRLLLLLLTLLFSLSGLAMGGYSDFRQSSDLVNAGISAARGDFVGAGFNLASALPGLGDAFAAGKIATAAVGVAVAKSASHAVSSTAATAAKVEAAVVKEGAGAGITLADDMAILRQAANGKGNFGVGSASQADAMRIGQSWVGEGSRTSGNILISKDGLRQFRPPSLKPNSTQATTGTQAERGRALIIDILFNVFQMRLIPDCLR